MSVKTFVINSSTAQYTDEELQWLQSQMLNEGIFGDKSNGTLGLQVTERSVPDMNVEVAVGSALVEVTISGRTMKVIIDSTAIETIAVASNSSGSDRVDAIIIRVDKDTEPSALKTNVGTIELVTGSGASALSDSAIDTAVSNDGWYRLADVTVPDSATTIVNSNIADLRAQVQTTSAIKIEDANNPAFTSDDVTISGEDQTQTTSSTTLPVGEADAASNNVDLAQSFIVGKSKMRGVKLFKKADTGTFTGDVVISLQADASGAPSGTALGTVTISNADWLDIADDSEFEATFTSEVSAMTLSNTYWIVIEPSTNDTSNHPNLGGGGGNPYANGGAFNNNTTDGWVAIVNTDLYFKTLEGNENQIVKTNSDGEIDAELVRIQRKQGRLTLAGAASSVISLGFRPRIVRVFAVGPTYGTDQQDYGQTVSTGAWTEAESDNCAYSYPVNGSGGGSSTDNYAWRIQIGDASAGSDAVRGRIIDVTDDGFTLNQTQIDNWGGTAAIFWEAEGN